MEPAENKTNVLLIESDPSLIERIRDLLSVEHKDRFDLLSVPERSAAMNEFAEGRSFDLVLISFKQGSSDIEELRKIDARIPIIVLGEGKDLTRAVETLRTGGNDFIPMDALDEHVFPQILLRHHERHQLISGVEQLDVRRERLEAMQELVVSVSEQITEPLERMRQSILRLEERNEDEKAAKYLTLVRENLDRLSDKMDRLRNLKDDKTVKYIKDINMIDLS